MMWKHVQNDMLSAMHHLKESDQTVKERISKKTSAMVNSKALGRIFSFYHTEVQVILHVIKILSMADL